MGTAYPGAVRRSCVRHVVSANGMDAALDPQRCIPGALDRIFL
jgi:hypothetical protein